MNLKPELQSALDFLGVTSVELETLKSRMMFSVTNLQAQVDALNSQIDQLTAQRDSAKQELDDALATAAKLAE